MASTNASIFLVIRRALAVDFDYIVLFVKVNCALLCLDVRVGSHDGVVYCARKGNFVLIAKFIVKLKESSEGNGVIGHHSHLDLHMLLSQGQQFPLNKVDVDLD